MASATKTYVTRTARKTVEVQEQVPTVTLVLSADEAETLAAIAYRTAGSPDTSPRKHVDAVGDALREAGVRQPGGFWGGRLHPNDLVDDSFRGAGTRFKDYPAGGGE